MSDVAETPREELECKKKYLYEYSMFWECNDGSKCQILEEDVCEKLNMQQAIIQELERKVKKYAKIGEEQLKQIIELQEENEQLRKQVAEYEMILRQHEFAEQEGFR